MSIHPSLKPLPVRETPITPGLERARANNQRRIQTALTLYTTYEPGEQRVRDLLGEPVPVQKVLTPILTDKERLLYLQLAAKSRAAAERARLLPDPDPKRRELYERITGTERRRGW